MKMNDKQLWQADVGITDGQLREHCDVCVHAGSYIILLYYIIILYCIPIFVVTNFKI